MGANANPAEKRKMGADAIPGAVRAMHAKNDPTKKVNRGDPGRHQEPTAELSQEQQITAKLFGGSSKLVVKGEKGVPGKRSFKVDGSNTLTLWGPAGVGAVTGAERFHPVTPGGMLVNTEDVVAGQGFDGWVNLKTVLDLCPEAHVAWDTWVNRH